MNQMVQNFIDFVSNTFFWLAYIPFYERFFPVFEMTNGENKTTTKEEKQNLNFTFKLDDILDKKYQASPRHLKSSGKTFEISFGRFATLLGSFADCFDGIERYVEHDVNAVYVSCKFFRSLN